MFSVHTTPDPEEFENAANTGHFGFVFKAGVNMKAVF